MADLYDDIAGLSARLVAMSTERDAMVTTAESCTGGMIAAAITDNEGASIAFERGFVTYANQAKVELLGVDAGLIESVGAVSGEVAGAMAEGALARSNADIAISVTGIAGPGGGSDIKPVGLVWFGCASAWAPTLVVSRQFEDRGRAFIRAISVVTALQIVVDTLDGMPQRTPDSQP
ncbi:MULTISPECIES: CinA family protein [unclassified Roseitalea]|uniref:CinA family protein n=1 Tax=unclassified Roseitalea TaxID=2639107 RepID=UPI00273FB8B6|nr:MULTISPECIES: CinA family protein [unclassified Roseitalea]